MTRVDIGTAQARLAEVLDASREGDVVIEQYGVPVGVLVSTEWHERLSAALEEWEATRAFDEAMVEEGPNVAWNEVEESFDRK